MSELTVGYRIPGPAMELAGRILTVAAPDLKPPVSVRQEGDEPRYLQAPSVDELVQTVVEVAVEEAAIGDTGNVAVICPQSVYDELVAGFELANVRVGRAPRDGLDRQITVVPVNLVKGLEVDASIVVEPAAILEEEPQGARSLYVACTRATKRLSIVNARPLPELLA